MALKRNRVRFGALLFSLALIAGACGGGGDGDKKVATDKTTTTESSTDVTLDTNGSTTTGAGGATSTTKKGATTTTAKAGGGSPGTTAGPSSDPNAVPSPAKTGEYKYSQSGTTPNGPVDAQGKLVVSGGQTQQFQRYYNEGKPPLTLTYAFRDNGPYITGATMSFGPGSATCTFGNGVPVPPWPPTVGATFSGSGTCPTPLGPLAATISGRVTSRSGDIVGIDATVHAQKAAPNSVDVTLHDVEQWSISLRVPKSSRQTFSGSALGSPISGDVTSTLTSTP